MSETQLAQGKVDGAPIHVGDYVLVRGLVRKSIAGVGALVRFTSKTENFDGWICEDDLRWPLVDGDMPLEPADGTWLLVDGSLNPDGNPKIFRRDDAEGHWDADRRYQQHWFDVVAQEWIDWAAAVGRGAARVGVATMTVNEESE